MKQNIPFSPPFINREIIEEVVDALQSGWITSGPKMKALEKTVEDFSKIPKALCVNSATAGMELMLRWFGVQEGDEVIVPAYTYCSTANVVLHCGATPVMVDVRADDFTIDTRAIAKAVTNKTKVIMPVDIGGYPCDYTEIWDIIHEQKDKFQPRTPEQEKLGRIMLLADAAHSLGANYENSPAAQCTDVAVYSFHAVKNLTTAEGGAVALNLPKDDFDNEEIYKSLYIKILHGQTKDALAKTTGVNSWEYDVVEAGYKWNMPDVLAAIGLAGMRSYKPQLERRRDICEMYEDELGGFAWAELPICNTGSRESSYHLYMLRIKKCTLAQRNEIISLIFEQGVSVNVHYKPLPLLTVYKNLDYKIDDYPVTKSNWEREISLPVYPHLTDAQVHEIVAAVAKAVTQVLVKVLVKK